MAPVRTACHTHTAAGPASSSSSIKATAQRSASRINRTMQTVVCSQYPLAPTDGDGPRKVKLSFRIPYRTHYGQDICMVGSTEVLGNWDPHRGKGMQWSEGDVWQVDFEVHAGPQLELEYKYVVRNPDGGVCLWKPGSNYSFSLSSLAPVLASSARQELLAGVAVRDAWDGAVRDVQVELADEREQHYNAYRESLAAALEDLAAELGQAEELSDTYDPISPEAFAADRAVAAAARKAVALSQALTAVEAQSHLAAVACEA